MKPIPIEHGVGFTSSTQLPEYASTYQEVKVNDHCWNYLFIRDNFKWPPPHPLRAALQAKLQLTGHRLLTIDGFSPNLNKDLHVGHLRNLATALSFQNMLNSSSSGDAAQMVAILGATLGIKDGAIETIQQYFKWLGYNPKCYIDTDLELSTNQHAPSPDLADERGMPEVWYGPCGPVIVIKGDKKKTYSYYDLAFAQLVSPDYYLTGVEQKEHFEKLGLEAKHLPMGLVMGQDGKKMKSRSGDAFSFEDALAATLEALNKTPAAEGDTERKPTRELAWNVLAWNMLAVSRTQNVKFKVEDWCRPEASGLYITYTSARIWSALVKAYGGEMVQKLEIYDTEKLDLQEIDWKLLGFCQYSRYWHVVAVQKMDSAVLAQYTHDLARYLAKVYHAERIIGGRHAFQVALYWGLWELHRCMRRLGMFILQNV